MTRYIVRLREGVDPNAFANELTNVVRVLARLRMVVVDMDEAAAAALAADPRVEYVEEDREGQPTATQTITNEWQLDRIDQTSLPLDGQYNYTLDGDGVTIYIIDSGIRATHVEFTGRIDTEFGFSALDDEPYIDNEGHGTAVAAIAAGTTTGVAKGATLVSVRVMNISSVSSSNMAAGAAWILDNHDFDTPGVVNVSLGWSGGSSIADAAVQDLLDAGLMVTVAAMNASTEAATFSPARVEGALTVSGTTPDDEFVSNQNYGEAVDVLAPGYQVWTTKEDTDDQYRTWNGSSFAAPLTAGVIALYLEQEPSLTPEQLHLLIVEEAVTGQITERPEGTPDRLLRASVAADAPAVPANLTATAVDYRSIQLTWEAGDA